MKFLQYLRETQHYYANTNAQQGLWVKVRYSVNNKFLKPWFSLLCLTINHNSNVVSCLCTVVEVQLPSTENDIIQFPSNTSTSTDAKLQIQNSAIGKPVGNDF